MRVNEMKVGDLFPRPRLRLQADGVGVDLSEAVSVVARVRLPGATESVEREVTVADQDVTANFGIVTIVLVAGDTDYRGTIKFDIEVTWATGVQTWPSKGYFKIWLLEDADSAQGGAIPLTSQHDALTLGRLYDVTIDDPEDGQVLQYDDTLGRWVNTAGAPDYSAYFTISRGNVASAEYAGNDIEWRIGAAASQSSVFAMENSEATALTIETLTTDSAVLRAGSALNENLYLFNDRGIAVNVQDNAAALTVKGGAVGSVAVFRGGAVAGNLTTWQDNASSVLASVSAAGLATFAGVTLTDATNLVFGTSTGTKIGTATSQKLGFYNATPIIRPSGSVLTALSNLGLVGSPTLASTELSDTANLAYRNIANTFTAQQFIDGSADEIQLRVQGHSTQTSSIQTWEDSSANVIARIGSSGFFASAGGFGNPSAGNPYILPASGSLTALSQNAAHIPWTVKGATSQSANLTQWQNSSGTALAYVSALGGSVFATTAIGTTNQYGAVSSINTVANGNLGLVIRAAGPSQSANMLEAQNSSASVLASISAAGLGTFTGVASTDNISASRAQNGNTQILAQNTTAGTASQASVQVTSDAGAGYIGFFKYSSLRTGYKFLAPTDGIIYNSAAGHISILNDATSGLIRFAAGGASSAQVQIETTGKLTTLTPTASAASVRLPHGTAPTSPVDGDMWTTSAGAYIRVNGVTKQIQFV